MKKALLSIAAAAVCMTGMANAQGISEEEVIELYVGTFNRAADAAGLRYWIHDRLKSQEEQAKAFFHSVEAYKLYPEWMNHRDLIRTIYHNLFGRYPEEAGIAYWTEQLENGTFERDTMLLAIMEGAMKQDAATIQNKVVIGAAAVLLGPITVGEGAKIGANSVVISSVPPGATVVGVPGKVVEDRRKPIIDLEHGKLPDPLSEMMKKIHSRQKQIVF